MQKDMAVQVTLNGVDKLNTKLKEAYRYNVSKIRWHIFYSFATCRYCRGMRLFLMCPRHRPTLPGIRSAKGGFDNNQFQGSAGLGRQRLEGFHTLMRMISALRRKATVRCDCYIRSLIGCS